SKNPNRGPIVMQLSGLLNKFPDKGAVLETTRALCQPYLASPEAHYAIGVSALVAGQVDVARTEADAALAIKPSWEQGAILEAQVAFSRALKQNYREPTSIYLGMGQAAEGLKRYEEAIGWYQKVEAGDWVRAQLKIATLIARQQGLAAGRDYLQRIEARSQDD